MIYLLTQILLCLALAALSGGALGWLLQRSRSAARLEAAHRALAAQARQLERARGDVNILTDDFDDLRERSRLEIDALRQENRQLPALTDNLEKSQLLFRQMLQRHDSRERELDATNAALEGRIALLQEQVVTHERALAAAARAAAAVAGGNASANADAAMPDGSAGAERAPSVPAGNPVATPDARMDAAPTDPLPGAAGNVPDRPAGVADGTSAAPEVTPMPRRGWASLPLVGGDGPDAGDETLDEVMEVDDDLAAELREGIDTLPRPAREAETAVDRAPDEPLDEPLDGVSEDLADEILDDTVDTMAHEDHDGSASDDWDDEEANATLAIEVFSMDDVHGVEDLDVASSPEGTAPGTDPDEARDPLSRPLFRPVDRQDDLKRLFGIGPVTEKALYALGITSYPQLAKLERPEIERIAEALDIVPERIESDDWVGNARRQLEDVLEEL